MPGKRITMKQVAERAGVSRTTVSFVLNNTPNVNIPPETRERILNAARELHYARDFAATSLATGRAHTIAFILRQPPEELSVDAFMGGLLNGVSQAVNHAGYHLLFYAMGLTASKGAYAELIRSQRVDGLLISGPLVEDSELLDLHAEGVPLVIQGTPDMGDLPSVDVDNVASARMATEHLISLGHRRIGLITNGPLTYTSSRDRLTGFVQALEAASIPVDEEFILSGEFSDDSGMRAMEQLLVLPDRPTAVFIASDVVALGAIRTIRERGLHIPEDISIVGFDDIPLAQYLEPGLTTVHLPRVELGLQAGKMLMDFVDGKPVPERHLRLNTTLIIRGSTAPLK